jgi:hypothetical protein
VRDAAAAYAKVAARTPSVIGRALLWGLALTAVGGAFGFVLGGAFGAIAAGAFGFLAGFGIARPILAGSHLFEGTHSVDSIARQAFDREYARSRGLEPQEVLQFRRAYPDLPIPGVVESVQVGEVPTAGIPGLLVTIADSPVGSPGSVDALIAEPPIRPTVAAIDALPTPKGYSVEPTGDRSVIVSHRIDDVMARTAEGCDEFRRSAGDLIAKLI